MELAGVVEPWLVVLSDVGGQQAGEGLAVDHSVPLEVRAVELWRIVMAAAVRFAAAHVAAEDSAG